MFNIDVPPTVWIPPKPAIIRPAEHSLLKPGAFAPITSKIERDYIIKELVKNKRLTKKEAEKAILLAPVVGFLQTPVSKTYLSSNSVADGSATHTWTGVTLGTQYPYFIIASGYTSGSGANLTFISLTVAGSPATLITSSHAAYTGCALWIVALTSSSGNIVQTLSAGPSSSHWYGIWGIQNLISSSPLSTDSKNDNSADIRVAVTASVTDSSGIIVGAASTWNMTFTDTWTGSLGNVIDFYTSTSGSGPFPAGNGVAGAGNGSSMTINSPQPGSSSAVNTACLVSLR